MVKDVQSMPVVLIVDDYHDAREMYAAYLEFAGLCPITASDGYQALRLASEALPDVILMDLGLPGIDGFEVTRRLKDEPRTRHIPVIALTAHDPERLADDLQNWGFVELLTKPCLPDELLVELERVIERVRERRKPNVAA